MHEEYPRKIDKKRVNALLGTEIDFAFRPRSVEEWLGYNESKRGGREDV
jgi:hypothetical protein